MADLISVIVSTYNREDALDAVLRGLAGQTDRGFEVIVADDGSGSATADLVRQWAQRLWVPLRHVWHEDRGFRLAEARNRAILASRGAYCIFLDGDCIPRPGFVAAHRKLSEPGYFVSGNRVLLARQATERVLREQIPVEAWPFGTFLRRRIRGDVNRLMPLIGLPLARLRYRLSDNWEGARGANLAVYRSDLDRVDGFDAAFAGWGLEDTDLVLRLFRAGVRRKDGRFATGVIHLWHPEQDRSRVLDNARLLEKLEQGEGIRASQGLSALAAAPNPSEGRGAAPLTAS